MFSGEPLIELVDPLKALYETDGATSSVARVELERRYRSILKPTDKFDRRLVSYQGNKSAMMHRWFRYKEGFSAQLVQKLIDEFGLKPGKHILDPFAGVSTTMLVARDLGLDATGIELLPLGDAVWRAKSRASEYDRSELKNIRKWVASEQPGSSSIGFPHVAITQDAFDPQQEAHLMWYQEQFRQLDFPRHVHNLLNFVLLSVLEDISYTSKDGQFLRWDSRSQKVRRRNAKRLADGRRPTKTFHKAAIMDVKSAILAALDLIIVDISLDRRPPNCTHKPRLIQGSVLDVLPSQAPGQYDAVITSPPYCNRYDYTRTYALELAFLGMTDKEILSLRQELLSCTVENRPKLKRLRKQYIDIDRQRDFEHVMRTVLNNSAFQETLDALRTRSKRREVNNNGIISMVEGYFTELAFVTFELYRLCKTGASVAIVNDNVRYSGEIIPVDLIMTNLAASFGFTPEKVYVLAQRKGNSSQQMGRYGREALRKSILVWKK